MISAGVRNRDAALTAMLGLPLAANLISGDGKVPVVLPKSASGKVKEPHQTTMLDASSTYCTIHMRLQKLW
jgi:hypothetical protein